MYDLFYNRMFLDPAVKGEIPAELMEILRSEDCMFEYREEELELIKDGVCDNVGLNLYFPMRMKACLLYTSAFPPMGINPAHSCARQAEANTNLLRGRFCSAQIPTIMGIMMVIMAVALTTQLSKIIDVYKRQSTRCCCKI